MLDIVAAHDEEALTRADHQCLDYRQALVVHSARDAGHAPFARNKSGAADQGENQEQGTDVARDFDELHAGSKEPSTLITR